jgi:hypothetical protein
MIVLGCRMHHRGLPQPSCAFRGHMTDTPNPDQSAKFAAFTPDELTPAAFPHPIARLDVHETHISWVVLTGPFAYKIKKSVRFDFLDASTMPCA